MPIGFTLFRSLRFLVLGCATASVIPALSRANTPVLIEIAEHDLGAPGEWPAAPAVTERYTEEAFGLFALPHKYVATGVRGDRAAPTLVRASAEVTLPAGTHRLLLRARGASRLLIDGRVVLETPFWQPETFEEGNIGELPMAVQDDYLNLGPNFRFAPPGTREAWTELAFTGAAQHVVLETRIGDISPKNRNRIPFRPELGETVVAFSPEGSTDWWLLAPGREPLPYTDAAWGAYTAERTVRLEAMNAQARADLRARNAAYWNRRRAEAASWLDSTTPVAVPALPEGFSAANPIDHFIAARIAQSAAEQKPAAAGGPDFFRDVRPILEANCYSCHQGGKVKGGLRLDNRADALAGGKADGPAVIPGHPDDSPLIFRILSEDPEEVMPAKGDRLSEQEIATLTAWVEHGAHWPEIQATRFTPTPLADDLTFLRRVTLDTVGVVPSETEITAFLADDPGVRRTRVIDRLLADPRWADQWMGYWQDVLAENPNLINPTLNNTGPFRWWIHESLLDNKPLDLFVTELLRLEGSIRGGGPAGFGVASENDVPMAAKGIILSSAFLGVEMKCARCHDSPAHTTKQSDLFSIAAMLQTKPIVLPETSSVALDKLSLGGRTPLIEVTLAPGSSIDPAWPFAQFIDESTARHLAETPENPRDLLAALVTAPQNERFAQVMANRIWQRFMGRGLVEELGDWEKAPASHPELLAWLGRELVRSGYDMKALSRLILNTETYQRAADPTFAQPEPLFAAPAERRIAAEQLVDSLFAATGKPFHVEQVCLDVDSVRTMDNALDLGVARRAWMLGSISNERDRPSLTLPRIQAVSEVLQVFGWRAARPDSGSGIRDTDANVLQPALLSNGTMVTWLTRLSDDHGFTALALEDQSLDVLLDRVFLRLFTRKPTPEERRLHSDYLRAGYAERRSTSILPVIEAATATPRVRPPFVAWSNHMLSEANSLRMVEETAARRGDSATTRLDADWRRRFEDVIWALLNAPEWTRIP